MENGPLTDPANLPTAMVPQRVYESAIQGCPSCGGARTVPCPTCGAQPSPPAGTVSLVFAIGRIEPQFPRLSIEKEFAQATSRANTAGLTDSAVLRKVLSQRENRYLARHLCWLMTINGVESYVAAPADAGDVDLLIESLRPRPEPTDLDVLIGVQTEIAPPEMCNGLRLPIVVFDQLYSFDRASLLSSWLRGLSVETTQIHSPVF